MAIFSDCSVALDLRNIPFKEKKKLMTAILDNGGNISYVVNQKCSFVVATSLENISNSKWKNAQKHQTPVVGLQYVWSCLEKGLLLPAQEHILKPQSLYLTPEQAGLKSGNQPQTQNIIIHDEKVEIQVKDGKYLGRFRLYKENDHDIPEFPSDFQVAKYSILSKPNTCSVLELQSAKGQAGQQYRVVSSIMHGTEKSVLWDNQVHSCSSEDAVEAYLMLSKELQTQGFNQTQTLPSWAENLTSDSLQQLLLEEKLNCNTVSQEVGVFVELIWTEALGSLSSILTVPVTSISLNDVSRVEGLLLQVQKTECEDAVKGLLEEVNTLLPLRIREPDSKNKLVSQKLDLCQLIRDILNMTEATLGNPCPSSLGKYRALRCSIEQVPPQSPEFLSVCKVLQDRPAQIQQILRVSRGTELHMFRNEIGNIKSLLHSTASSSLVGILSRGLLLPRVGVEQHGIERTDIGNLGSGIYFSDTLNTSVKYSKPSVTDGSRLLLVCEVALGQCTDLHKRDFTLISAPEGYNSVHGVRRTQKTHSDFEDDEYVVYNTDQIRLKYVIQYFLTEDEVKDFQPLVDTTLAPLPLASSSHLLSTDDGEGLGVTKNSLDEVTAGLLDSNGQTLPLQAVHVRCKLMDLLSQVVIFQTYTNNSNVPIEAKYVFPLEETAAVCGFEAFINGKHVIGKVKEKEQARKEYKQAIEKGHGAYLMDQDAPDVFTISVGNLPPGATVLIKVTFITELVVRAGTIIFSLPGSVAPWQQSSALNQKTQTTVEKVCVNELQPKGEFSLCMSIKMPYKIMNLECSHQIKFKRTDCKAVVSTSPDQTLSTDGFRLSFTLFQIHMPRMWVEKHPEKDTEACMLVFYPHFESSGFSVSDVSDVIIVLDTSESMRGDAMLNARRIALKVLNSLDRSLRVNIISFGSDYKEAFPSPTLIEEVFEEAKNFIMSSAAVGGSTELWRPLRTLNLLPPSRGVRNVLLISDGHVQNQPQTLQLVRDNVRHTRLFTCGLNLTANRYMLRALAQAGGGTYEFFDTKTKYTWAEKVNFQVRCMVSPGCSSVAVKWQQFNPTAPSPVQAPSQLHALFNDCHTLVYGFVPHCTQATLFGDLSGQEIETMVSTTELQKTKGTFLHKLTARAIIRDYEDGILGSSEAEHEGKKAELKSYIIELSKEFSILSQFTSFVAVEERDQEQPESSFTDIPKIIAEEDVDILSYMGWSEHKQLSEESDSSDISGPSEYFLLDCLDRSVECYAEVLLNSFEQCAADDEESETETSDISLLDSTLTLSQLEPPMFAQLQTGSAKNWKERRSPPLDNDSDTRIYVPQLGWRAAKLVSGPDTVGSLCPQQSSNFSPVPDVLNLSTRSSDSLQNTQTVCSPLSNNFEYSAKRRLKSHFQAPFPIVAVGASVNVRGSPSPSDSFKDPPSPVQFGASIPSPIFIAPASHSSRVGFGVSLFQASHGFRASAHPSPGVSHFGAPAPPPPSVSHGFGAPAPPPPSVSHGFGAPAPPPPSVSHGFGTPAPPPPSVSHGFGAPAPPPPSVSHGFGTPAPPLPCVSHGFEAPALSFLSISHGFGAPAPPSSSVSPGFGAPAPPPPGVSHFGAPAPPSPGVSLGFGVPAPPSPGVSHDFGGLALPPPNVRHGFGAPAPPPPSVSHGFGTPALPFLSISHGFGVPAPPGVSHGFGAPAPPSSSISHGFGAPAPPPPSVSHGFGAPAPPPPSVSHGFGAPAPPSSSISHGFGAPAPLPPSVSLGFGASAPPPPGVSLGFGAPAPPPPSVSHGFGASAPPPPGVSHGFGASAPPFITIGFAPPVHADTPFPGPFFKEQSLHTEAVAESKITRRRLPKFKGRSIVPLEKIKSIPVQPCSISEQYRQPDRIDWDELFNLQHQDGYWECTGTLSRFLGLDVDFFANVFLKKKGICSLGAKAHAVILKLVATLLVLQLMRVRKLADGELFQSLFRLTDHPEARPDCWEAVKKAVTWVCWADRQYPCVYSRLELGWNWESCTRQLLGLDSLPPFSPLISVLQRSTHLPVM